jgi:hypothetical protein
MRFTSEMSSDTVDFHRLDIRIIFITFAVCAPEFINACIGPVVSLSPTISLVITIISLLTITVRVTW